MLLGGLTTKRSPVNVSLQLSFHKPDMVVEPYMMSTFSSSMGNLSEQK